MLTSKQHQLLIFIRDRLEATGISPSFEEMKAALNLRSKSGIHRLITALEERGFIRRLPHRARALEVLRLPESAVADAGRAPPEAAVPEAGPDAGSGFSPSVIEGGFGRSLEGVEPAANAEVVALPLYGRIAAGLPIEALSDPSNTINVPASLLGRGEHYALEIEGDSMIEAGIHDSDTAIIARAATAENGAIVVALVDGQEVTLKRLRRKGNAIALESANSRFETRIFGPDRVQVQGRLIGLIRRY